MTTALLRERYEPLAVVAEGGEGSVIRAHDHQHGRPTALKVRRVHPSDERDGFLHEARVLLDLTPHPNLPVVRDDFFTDDTYVIVMDWIEGRSLHEVLEAEGGPGLGLDRTLDLLTDAAAALDHLHSHDPAVVHRDVKPANLILTGGGRVVLVDFGISTHRAESGRRGTWGYMAPELVAGRPATAASDVYGLAATAFALLNGEPHRLGVRPGWPGLRRSDSRRVEEAMRSGLALDPRRRPATAGELLALMRPRPRRLRPEGPTNLPTSLTTFVGRRDPIGRVRSLVRSGRLVTLTGEGGVGKTRLAYEVARRLRRDHPDGVWVVELAPLTDPALVLEQVAAALGAGDRHRDAIVEAVGDGSTLLVLDNCEHVVDTCAAAALDLLRACPNLRILATSRQALGVTGETVWRVPPLSVPEDEHGAQSEAVKLFVERARQARPAFEVLEGGWDAVARLCRRLDGIPLAIELAAARAKTLSVAEIDERLADRFRLLSGPALTPTSHHATLLSALDWSFDLLGDTGRDLLARLSVFAGGWTLEGAEAVCASGRLPEEGVLDEVARLVDRSLVHVTERGGRTRYGMLETVREYAAAKLAGPESDDARRRHLEWLRLMSEQAATGLSGPGQARWLDVLETEHDNFRVALDFAAQGADPATGLEIAVRLADFWTVRGYVEEGRRRLAQALRAPTPDEALRARALSRSGVLASHQGDHDAALACYSEALEILRRLGDERRAARVLNDIGAVAHANGDLATASRRFEESLDMCRRLGDRMGQAEALANLAHVAHVRGDLDRASEVYHQSLEIDRELGNRRGQADTLSNLGALSGTRGRDGEAEGLFTRSLEIRRELGDRRGIAECLGNLALVAQARGADEGARALYAESLEIDRELGNRTGQSESLCGLGRLALRAGEQRKAAEYLDEALSVAADLPNPALAVACLECAVLLELGSGRHDTAALLHGYTTSVRLRTGLPRSPAEETEHELGLADVRTGLPNFQELVRRGGEMTAAEAVATARAGIRSVLENPSEKTA